MWATTPGGRKPTAPPAGDPGSIHHPAPALCFNQVHGTGVAALTASTPDNTEADACVATDAGVVCTIMVADCLPVLLGPHQWRRGGCCSCGLAGPGGPERRGVLESAMRALFERFQALALINKAQAAIENVANNAESLKR